VVELVEGFNQHFLRVIVGFDFAQPKDAGLNINKKDE